LFVLDLLLPGVKGATAISDVKKMYPEVPLVVLSAMPSGEARDACLEAGADLYIEKSTDTAEISAAIQDILKSDSDEADADVVVVGDIKLSKRQKQLILMLDRGLSNRDIAAELNISEHTVKVHLWRLFRRLGVKSRTQTLHFARTHGLLMG
jgi:DNA-binding NarL/FixJ family response regulator